jgi:hypothetical protein
MDQPDPAQAASLEDLAHCLRHLRTLADTPTYRELERRTVQAEGVLPGTHLRRVPLKRATIAEVLAGHTFPRKAFLLTLVEACGIDIQEDRRWEQAWIRLAIRYQAQSVRSRQVAEPLTPTAQQEDDDAPSWDRVRAQTGGPQQTAQAISEPVFDPAYTGTTKADMTRSQSWVLTDFLESAAAASDKSDSLLGRLAWRQVERVTKFMQQLPSDQRVTYDGEDPEWLLGLTQETQHSIDAVSMSTVDAAMLGLDGGLWTSVLGAHYMELQRKAIERGVSVRRIFVFENDELIRDEYFLRIAQMHRDAGVNIRIIDLRLVPERLVGAIFRFAIFDSTVSYEVIGSTSFRYGGYGPLAIRTVLVPTPSRVQFLKNRFEQLWDAANPERFIGD